MIEALKNSDEPEHLVREAMRYLKGLKGNLVQIKKQKMAKERAAREEAAAAVMQQQHLHNKPHYQGQPQQSYGNPMYGQQPQQPGPGFYTTYGWMR